MDSSVRVAVRVRPQVRRSKEHAACVTCDGSTIVLQVPDQVSADGQKKRSPVKRFAFDHVYDQSSTQEEIFDTIGRPVLRDVTEGYNACVFAYGQTGSGKTFSMTGGLGEDRGLIPRLCEGLFQYIDETKSSTHQVQAQYFEIYAERAYDLLRNNAHDVSDALPVRQQNNIGVYVEGLTSVVIGSYEDVERILRRGQRNRVTASTLMNQRSSRSHAILTLRYTQRMRNQEVSSCINLVDLAGSERVSDSGVTGRAFNEARNINQSLSVLRRVIEALAERSKAGGRRKKKLVVKKGRLRSKRRSVDFVPFRESILTFILKDSLGGNSRTYVLATVSPSDQFFRETHSTLKYVNEAKRIVNTVTINKGQATRLVVELHREIARLQEVLRLKTESNADEEELEALRQELAEHQRLAAEQELSWEDRLRTSTAAMDQFRSEAQAELEEAKNQHSEELTAIHEQQREDIRRMSVAERERISAALNDCNSQHLEQHAVQHAELQQTQSQLEEVTRQMQGQDSARTALQDRCDAMTQQLSESRAAYERARTELTAAAQEHTTAAQDTRAHHRAELASIRKKFEASAKNSTGAARRASGVRMQAMVKRQREQEGLIQTLMRDLRNVQTNVQRRSTNSSPTDMGTDTLLRVREAIMERGRAACTRRDVDALCSVMRDLTQLLQGSDEVPPMRPPLPVPAHDAEQPPPTGPPTRAFSVTSESSI